MRESTRWGGAGWGGRRRTVPPTPPPNSIPPCHEESEQSRSDDGRGGRPASPPPLPYPPHPHTPASLCPHTPPSNPIPSSEGAAVLRGSKPWTAHTVRGGEVWPRVGPGSAFGIYFFSAKKQKTNKKRK
ncbi:hypothetical protein INR49_017894 [Caranx melampygus]|nr:hypothetical protein INR49_017894 [Caranx melampygus]